MVSESSAMERLRMIGTQLFSWRIEKPRDGKRDKSRKESKSHVRRVMSRSSASVEEVGCDAHTAD
jgi:stalled ribosome alternative rescue factor ArfA